MKDLKHIYALERLLQEAHNDLIRQAKERGEIAIGSVCSLIPEPLLNLPGCFSVRLRAPRTGSIEMGTYYMTSIMCEACRAILERAIEGGYQFLDCILAPDACAQMNRCVENIEHLQLCGKDGRCANIYWNRWHSIFISTPPRRLCIKGWLCTIGYAVCSRRSAPSARRKIPV